MTSPSEGMLLMQDALGHLYALPPDVAKQYQVATSEAKQLINSAESATGNFNEELESTGGYLKQIDGEDLPNFRLLMQTEYKSTPTR